MFGMVQLPVRSIESLVRGALCALSLVMLAWAVQPVQAQSLFGRDPNAGLTDFDQAVFFFGGRFQSGDFKDTFLLLANHYEDNYVVGGGYQRFFAHPGAGFHFGAEFGIAGRISNTPDPSSFETWYGYVMRHDGFAIGDAIRISPAISTGFSMVSGLIGIEKVRSSWYPASDPVSLLFYLGPEINITATAFPDWEMFVRIHHRSGLYGTIAHVDGSNAATVGVRYKF